MNPADARTSRSVAETERLGERLAAALADGDVLALAGELGSGKTRFVAGLARGLACRARVRSPSFALVHEYHGRLLLLHLDLYRLESVDAEGLGLEEYAERGVLAVEWGDRLPARWRAEALAISFESPGGDVRRLSASATAGRGLALLDAWRALPEPSGAEAAPDAAPEARA
jgi:tRNA threonylcarbamoyladenosine biosynthesis protein TsaE